MLCAERIVQVLDITLGNRNSFGVVLELLAYWMPHYVGLAAPVALYLGLLFGFNKMSKDSELDAFLAAGVGLGRLTRPVCMISVVLAVNAALMFGWIQPYSLYAYRATVYALANVDVFYLAEEGVFMQTGKRTFILDKLERRNNSFEHIFMYDDNGNGGSETITALNGRLVENPANSRPLLRLDDGHRMELKARNPTAATTALEPPVVGDFKSADVALGDLSERLFRPRGRNERELTLTELYSELQTDAMTDQRKWRLEAQFHIRLAMVTFVLILPFLALPFAIGSRRVNKAYRFAVALALLVAAHEVLQQGHLITRVSGTSVWLTIWLPFSMFAGFAFWRFYATCYTLPRPWLEPLLEDVSDTVKALWRKIRPLPATGTL